MKRRLGEPKRNELDRKKKIGEDTRKRRDSVRKNELQRKKEDDWKRSA